LSELSSLFLDGYRFAKFIGSSAADKHIWEAAIARDRAGYALQNDERA